MRADYFSIALIGGGPAAMFMYKQLLENNMKVRVVIFEKSGRLGAGMPYSNCGARAEHVTNVSSNEIPRLLQSPLEWLESTTDTKYSHTAVYTPYKVLPRLVFGDYLEAQFHNLLFEGERQGLQTEVYLNSQVDDIDYLENKVIVKLSDSSFYSFDKAVICTGHQFAADDESATNCFKSPYPPRKLKINANHAVAIRGASLTAVDAIKTLARANGKFHKKKNGELVFKTYPRSHNFKMVLHCRSGMLPAVRFHLADSHLKNSSLLSMQEIEEHRKANNGFLSLDYIFENDFLRPLAKAAPEFYSKVKGMAMEQFVDEMLELRNRIDPFTLLRSECNEASKSIKRKESIHWKEMLGVLSFAMNYPAKYFSAEDMLRFKKVLHPLISLVIAYIPQSSCRELLALHKAGCLDMVAVGEKSTIEQQPGGGIIYSYTNENGEDVAALYKTYVDCTGQPHINISHFPFKGLSGKGVVSQAKLAFRDVTMAIQYLQTHPDDVEIGNDEVYYLKVSGIAVNDNFQVLDKSGRPNSAIYMMAVPLMGGYNPDYSGLDFCEEASHRIASSIMNDSFVAKENKYRHKTLATLKKSA